MGKRLLRFDRDPVQENRTLHMAQEANRSNCRSKLPQQLALSLTDPNEPQCETLEGKQFLGKAPGSTENTVLEHKYTEYKI